MPTVNAEQLLSIARAEVAHVSVDQARSLLTSPDHVFVDVREAHEFEGGRLPGALHAPRGLLEWYLDPQSGMSNPELLSGKTLVMICGTGKRAVLAAKLAQDFGLKAIYLEGGAKAWRASGEAME